MRRIIRYKDRLIGETPKRTPFNIDDELKSVMDPPRTWVCVV